MLSHSCIGSFAPLLGPRERATARRWCETTAWRPGSGREWSLHSRQRRWPQHPLGVVASRLPGGTKAAVCLMVSWPCRRASSEPSGKAATLRRAPRCRARGSVPERGDGMVVQPRRSIVRRGRMTSSLYGLGDRVVGPMTLLGPMSIVPWLWVIVSDPVTVLLSKRHAGAGAGGDLYRAGDRVARAGAAIAERDLANVRGDRHRPGER